MAFVTDMGKCIKDLEKHKQNLKKGIMIPKDKLKYLKTLQEYLEFMGKLLNHEIKRIEHIIKTDKFNLYELNVLRGGINLWLQYESRVLKSEIPSEERKIAEENFRQLEHMTINLDEASKAYPNLEKIQLQKQVEALLKGFREMLSKILKNIEGI